ncbi:hypothetical protein TI05_06735 [Achromatium sp. WMS3]|nr:hypothetical protein TI05_06735 [Achromatium sp. WMS3]
MPFLIVYPLIRYTIGTEAYYVKMITKFENLSQEEQQRISKLGLNYFILSLVMSLIAVGWMLCTA